MTYAPPGRRVAIVAGLRTPFARSGTVFRDVPAVSLARHAARELLYRAELPGREVDEVVWGQVVASPLTPNVAREVSLLPQLPRTVPAYSLNRACASAGQAITNAHDQIALGHANVVLAGGVESLSDIPILHSKRFSRILIDAGKAKTLGQRVAAFARLRPRDLIPVSPAIAEPSTGESMGQSAEKMAKENRISREAQDRLALMSHQRAAAATADGRIPAEIAPWFAGRDMDQPITGDNLIRSDTSLEALAKLRPAFPGDAPKDMTPEELTVTAGNAPGLSDGAAALVVASEEYAKAHGLPILARITGYASGGGDPQDLFFAPILAVQNLMAKTGMKISGYDLIEANEAFAAQALADGDGLGWDWSRVNVNGGAVALGHPIGSSGARILTTLLYALRDRGLRTGLATLCLGGGNAVALSVELV